MCVHACVVFIFRLSYNVAGFFSVFSYILGFGCFCSLASHSTPTPQYSFSVLFFMCSSTRSSFLSFFPPSHDLLPDFLTFAPHSCPRK